MVSPDFLHRDPVVAALQAGKHVFVEKPLATTLTEVHELVQLSVASNCVTMVNYSQRFLTDYAWIKQAIDRGEIGQPLMVTSLKFDTIYVPTGMLSWAAQSSPFYFMSSHDLDLTHWFLGVDPVSVDPPDLTHRRSADGGVSLPPAATAGSFAGGKLINLPGAPNPAS